MMDPIQAIQKMMAEKGYSRRDLLDVFGTPARASEVMARRRRLSLDMIRRLSERYKMNANVLVRDYPMATRETTRHQNEKTAYAALKDYDDDD